MNAAVCNDRGWTNTTNMDMLRAIAAKPMGPRHNPVNHGEVLERFSARAENAGINVTAETGLLSPDKKRFMYVADIRGNKETTDYICTLGFVNFNDRTRSFIGICGTNVFVCSNLCISGIVDISKTRHTTNVDARLDEKMDRIVDGFRDHERTIITTINTMKSTKLTNEIINSFIVNCMRSEHIGATNVRRILNEIDSPTLNNTCDSSVWRLHNAMTYVAKQIKNPILRVESIKGMNDLIVGLI